MYKQIYYADFKDVNDNNIHIEIYKNTVDNVENKELTLSAEPLYITYESDNIFQPTKLSSASINVLTNEVLFDLYTSKTNEITCKIFKNNILLWFGYLSPNLYSSDYTDETNTLTLEFIDTLSQLEYLKYKTIDTTNNKVSISSFKDIIFSILNKIDIDKTIKQIYVSNSIQVFDNNDILNNIFNQERNFFDEENEPETAKKVIQEIAKYLSMTVMQWGDSIYFLDYISIGNKNSNFVKYDLTSSEVEVVKLDINTINVNEYIYESECTISLNDTYNKITLVANNNAVKTLLPDAIKNEEDIVNQNVDPNKYYNTTENINDEEHTLLTGYFKSKNNWEYQKPNYLKTVDSTDIKWVFVDEINNDTINLISSGVYWQKVESYKNNDGEPSSINWKTYLTFLDTGTMLNLFTPYLRLKNKEINIFKGGYFIVNLKFKLSRFKYAHDVLKTSDEQYSYTKFGAGFKNTLIPCRLAIGNEYYYNGEQWVTYKDYKLKIERSYYNNVRGPVTWEDAIWYRHYDDYGYQRFTTESVWNALPSSTKKDKGGYPDRNKMYYYVDGRDENEHEIKIFTTEEYYNECTLKDMFYLVHKNSEGEKVFDEDKTLTNTVSYKMNLVDSEDGVAIKLPPQVLVGELIFDIEKPNQLATYPMWVSNGGCYPCNAFHFSDMVLKYATEDTVQDIFNMEEFEADIKYTNTINEDYVNEFDDIELYVNTYNKQAGSFSYVITKNNNGYFDYIYTTYNTNTQESLKQEEHIIKKYYNYYSTPKFIYENKLKLDNITPYSLFYENTLSRNFILNRYEIDVQNNAIRTTLNEITN